MIRFPTIVLVATAPIDLRLSFDRLAGIIRDQLGGGPELDSVRKHLGIALHAERSAACRHPLVCFVHHVEIEPPPTTPTWRATRIVAVPGGGVVAELFERNESP